MRKLTATLCLTLIIFIGSAGVSLSADAQSILGNSYKWGRGVVKDKSYAYMWYNIAASNGHKYAGERRDRLERNMIPSQLEKAKDLTRECVRQKYKGC